MSAIPALGTVPTFNDERSPVSYAQALQGLMDEGLIQNFPFTVWNNQLTRYDDYWKWYDGTHLAETQGSDAGNDPIYKFPLHINFVRNAARKRAAVTLGEAEDSHLPLVRATVLPRRTLAGDDPAEAMKKLALVCENIINEVWIQSGGRGLQYENAVLGEFLGGCVFKLSWQPWRNDLLIPVLIEKVLPDHFLPIWNPRDPWDLLEVFEVFKINAATAKAHYGVETNGPWVIYAEHWTKEKYSIYVDGKPLQAIVDGRVIVYKDLENPWKRPPYAYIPTSRDGGSFFGASFVEDVRGIIKEMNSRMADKGDAIRNTVHRKRYLRNSHQTINEKQIGQGVYAIDLGTEPPGRSHPPEVYTEDPPVYSEGLVNFTHELWQQLLRESALQNIAFGEDEGSQRSALTLAFRFYPTTSKARATRAFWTDGLNWLARMIMRIVQRNRKKIEGLPEIPENFEKMLQFGQDWRPMIPRDREQEINEIILLYQAGLMSPERALNRLGDVKDIPEELQRIQAHLQFQSQLEAATKASGTGAKTEIATPVVVPIDKE